MRTIWGRRPMAMGLAAAAMTAALVGLCAPMASAARIEASPSTAGVRGTAEEMPGSQAQPDAAASLPACIAGNAYSNAYRGWCPSDNGAYYRTIAWCTNGDYAMGPLREDGSTGPHSFASCIADDNPSNLLATSTTTNAGLYFGWGYVLCTNNSGTGTGQGYIQESTTASPYDSLSQLIDDIGEANQSAYGGGVVTAALAALCENDMEQGVVLPPTFVFS
jgi:hypothetical protein